MEKKKIISKVSVIGLMIIMSMMMILTGCGQTAETETREYTNNLHTYISNYDEVEKIIWDIEGFQVGIVDGPEMDQFTITNDVENVYVLMTEKAIYNVSIKNGTASGIVYSDPEHLGHMIRVSTPTYESQKG